MTSKLSWWLMIVGFTYGGCERFYNAIIDSYFDVGELMQFVLVVVCLTLVNNLNPYLLRK